MFPTSRMIFLAVSGLGVLRSASAVSIITRAAELSSGELQDGALVQFRGANSSSPGQTGECDCNNPAHWDGDTLYVFNSAGHPWRRAGPDLLHLETNYVRCEYDNKASGGRWIECTWKVEEGTLYGWYH